MSGVRQIHAHDPLRMYTVGSSYVEVVSRFGGGVLHGTHRSAHGVPSGASSSRWNPNPQMLGFGQATAAGSVMMVGATKTGTGAHSSDVRL